MTDALTERFLDSFADMAVHKDLKSNNFFSALSLPSYLRDWLLQKYQDADGAYDQKEIAAFVQSFMPKPAEEWVAVKDRIVVNYETVKLLAKICVDIDVATGDIAFALPDYGVSSRQTMIEHDVWERCRGDLVSGKEVWGMLELGYRPPDDSARSRLPGKFRLVSFRNFCPYTVDIDFYREERANFSTAEWLDILLGAVDYNPAGYAIAKKNNASLPEVETMKLAMLARLLIFLEKRLNVIELAPKGTGKSYIFGQVSRYGWLSTSDKITRAKLFYDMGKKENGLLMQNDFLALDEIQKTIFADGLGSPLQGYLEQGKFSIGNFSGASDCGVALCGNIAPELMRANGYEYMFDKLPGLFHDPAIIDRFHGFIRGWEIPRMNDDLKICGWALNSEYFTAILHELRSQSIYRVVVDELVDVPAGADTRDTEAVKRLATAWLKLLFPHVTDAGAIDAMTFERYCLRPAMDMRYVIKYQLGLMDSQYKKELPRLQTARKGH